MDPFHKELKIDLNFVLILNCLACDKCDVTIQINIAILPTHLKTKVFDYLVKLNPVGIIKM